MPGFLLALAPNILFSAVVAGGADTVAQQIEMHFQRDRRRRKGANSLASREEVHMIEAPQNKGRRSSADTITITRTPVNVSDGIDEEDDEPQPQFSFGRCSRYVVASGIVGATGMYWWYSWALPPILPGGGVVPSALKDALSNTAFFAAYAASVFATNSLLEGRKFSELRDGLRSFLPAAMSGALTFWAPLQFFMFAWLPSQFHFYFLKMVGFFFHTSVAYVASSHGALTIKDR
eukprot:TRINITY_DN1772_c0_g1_i1.p1 TRINITY_DN1772_c0_g1~~TRINITY_DN1772_c0_g1_i1.p1  ORF type:complete len:234 (-),score=39.76 TRINITY_DN1772_c0_g1_i1:212-913(-)